MTAVSKHKKTIAREILLLFTILVLTGLIWIFMLVRNFYYDNKINSSQEKQIAITKQIDSLPSDKIKALYDGVKKDFVINYVVNNDKYAIPKKEENEFLKDFPTAVVKPVNQKGFSVFEPKDTKTKDGLSIFNNLVFDYVDLERFRELLKDSLYRNNFYKTFSVDYDLGTTNSFLSKLDTGFKYSNTTAIQYQRLSNDKQELQNSVSTYRNNVNTSKEIWQIVLWTFLILAIVLYPIRLCYYLLKWSIVTLKKNGT